MADFHEVWQSREVVVLVGPFRGWRGVVQGTYNPRVEVCFPRKCPHTERLWFHISQLTWVYPTFKYPGAF